jgi:glutaredoxin-like protein
MAQLLNDQIQGQIKELFGNLKEPVEIMFFGTTEECQYCEDTLQLVQDVSALSEKLSLSIHDIHVDADAAKQYHVDKTPGLVLAGRDGDQVTDFGVRYAGIPSGHEFSSFINDIVTVSNRDSGLTPQTREFLKGLTKPVHLQVFVTPT